MSGTDSAALLQQALALHQAGQLERALLLYQQVLALVPDHFDALHLSGVVARQQGRPQQAVELISRAFAVHPAPDPTRANAHCNLGAALQDLGRPLDALASYDHAIVLAPGYALAHSNRGNALRKLGRLDEALASYERALALQPGYPEAACQRAIVLHDLDRHDEALANAELALRGRPRYADALAARGNALLALGRSEEAIVSFDGALALAPARADILGWRGAAQARVGRVEDALASLDASLAVRPDHAATVLQRANLLRQLGRAQDAAVAYRQALALGGDASQIGYALAALGEAAAPAQAPSAYVTALFDQYADHFDHHLVDQLGYRTPALLMAALTRAGVTEGSAARTLDVVDLGCGTGLCAPLLRPMARHLTGVDLSPRMLARAAERSLYDDLACDDVVAWLRAHPASADLLVAADVLVYLGDLRPLLAAAHAALRAGGSFAFSVEGANDKFVEPGFALAPSQRYVHSRAYVERSALAAGWGMIDVAPAHLRDDGGIAVTGFTVVLRRQSGSGAAGA